MDAKGGPRYKNAVRIIVVSDSHLSPRTPEADHNWEAALRYVDRVRPDLVLHLGDLSLDGARAPDDLMHASRQLARLSAPWCAIPGNHDVGDNPSDETQEDERITAQRRALWLEAVGPDYFVHARDGWSVIAIDAQLFGSALDAEATQWDWLTTELGAASKRGDRIALLTHKPLTADRTELDASPVYRFVQPEARTRITELARAHPIDLVLSGHVHQFRVLERGATRHVWAPTTWAVLTDARQPTLGLKRCGLLELSLDGRGATAPMLCEPDGLRQLTLGETVTDPFHEPE